MEELHRWPVTPAVREPPDEVEREPPILQRESKPVELGSAGFGTASVLEEPAERGRVLQMPAMAGRPSDFGEFEKPRARRLAEASDGVRQEIGGLVKPRGDQRLGLNLQPLSIEPEEAVEMRRFDIEAPGERARVVCMVAA